MNDKKIEILLDSFEKLKANINDEDDTYIRTLDDIIEKMFSLDKYIAIDIWEYCLSERKSYDDRNVSQSNSLYFIVKCPFEVFLNTFGLEETLLLLSKHTVIKKTIYEKYPSISYDFCLALVNSNKLYELNDYLHNIEKNQQFMNNRHHDDGIGDAIAYLTNMSGFSPTSECVELLLEHAKLANKSNQSVINVNLIDYL